MPINLTAVLIASVVALVLQFLISGPLFGKLRARLENAPDAKPSNIAVKLVLNFVVNLITAYFIAIVYLYFSTSSFGGGPGIVQGVQCALLLWFGFLFTATSVDVIWGKKPFSLWLFESVAALVVYAAMGAVVAAM